VGNVIAARALGPEDFGRFGLVIAVVMITGTLADAGLTFAAVRFVARFHDTDGPHARASAVAYFCLRAVAAFAMTLVGLLLAEPVASGVLGQPGLAPLIALGMFTLPSLWLSSYPGTIMSGLAMFPTLAVAGLLNAAITVGGIVLLAWLGALNLTTLVGWNVVLPLLSSLPAWVLLPAHWRPWRLKVGLDALRLAGREVVRFGRWTAASTLGAIVAGNIDLLLMGRFADAASTGAYSVAVTLASRLDVLNQSLFTVMMPRASRLAKPAEVRAYTHGVARGATYLGAGLLATALFAQPFILLFYGEAYAVSVPVFLVLLPVVLIDLVTTSAMLVTFSTNQARLMAAGEWLRATTVAGIASVLVLPFGGVGAALARLASRLVGAAFTVWALNRRVLVPGRPAPAHEEVPLAHTD
jgi:O-antigen/teichoic acid export membrane protein